MQLNHYVGVVCASVWGSLDEGADRMGSVISTWVHTPICVITCFWTESRL